jgi:hypothetical protein
MVSRFILRSPSRAPLHSAWWFHQPLRQTEGFLRSIADVLGIFIAIPDHTTLSRRAGGLTILPKHIDRAEPLHLLVDRTGLRIYGEGEWLDQKHGIRSHRRWRKLHLGMNADTHEIVAVQRTPDDVGDVSEIPQLLDQIEADVASMTADGAYGGEAEYNAVAELHPDATVIILPRVTAVASRTTETQRHLHIETIARHGRMEWQRRSGYNRRSLIETAMFRYKTIVARRLNARILRNRRTEVQIGCNILNRMTTSACRPPSGSIDMRVGTGDVMNARSMHQRGRIWQGGQFALEPSRRQFLSTGS